MCAGCTERFVTVAQIAKIYGLTRADAAAAAASASFPEPVGEVTASSPPYSRTPMWRSGAVRAWMTAERAAAPACAV